MALGQKQLDTRQLVKDKIRPDLAREKARAASPTAHLREKLGAARNGKLSRGGRALRGALGSSMMFYQNPQRHRALGRHWKRLIP